MRLWRILASPIRLLVSSNLSWPLPTPPILRAGRFADKVEMDAAGIDDPSRFSEAIALLHRNGVRAVAFDMDQTAVAQHSRGRLRRTSLDAYLGRAVPDFVRLVPLLQEAGIGVGIATHSDEAEYDGRWVRPETHVLGSELARALLERSFEPAVARDFLM